MYKCAKTCPQNAQFAEQVDKIGEVDINWHVCKASCSEANKYYTVDNVLGQEIKYCQSTCQSDKWDSKLKCVTSCKELDLCGITETPGVRCD